MKFYYPKDANGNIIGFKTPESQVYDNNGTSLSNKLETKAPAVSSTAVTSGSLDNISRSTFALYSNGVSGMPSGISNSYVFVRTSIFDSSAALQELFVQNGSAAGTSYVRVKTSGTWGSWKQITN